MGDKKAILVVSFGTSYNETRERTIGAIEKKLAGSFLDFDIKRAFTSKMVIEKLAKRDGERVYTVAEAMENLLAEGYCSVIVQPTHIMNGEEYDKMKCLIKPYEKSFTSIKYGAPLLTSDDDYVKSINAVACETPKLDDKSCAVVFMGHGTEHFANAAYAALDYRFKAMGYNNAFVGTVEGYPDFDRIVQQLNEFKPESVYLVPFMIVAGDHAANDMAGDNECSWKCRLEAMGYKVEYILKGLGEYSGIRDMFVEHCKAVM